MHPFIRKITNQIYCPCDTRFGFILFLFFLIMPFVIGSITKIILWNESIRMDSFSNAIHTYFLGLLIILSISGIAILSISFMYCCSKCTEYIRKRKSQRLNNNADELEVPLYD